MYNPAIHTATNKPISLYGKSVEARSMFFDGQQFLYRAYANTAEVLDYLQAPVGALYTTAQVRAGWFSIFVQADTLEEYWFKDGTADADLILKASGGGSFVKIERDVLFSEFVPDQFGFTMVIDWLNDIPSGYTDTYAELISEPVMINFIAQDEVDSGVYYDGKFTAKRTYVAGVLSQVEFTADVQYNGKLKVI